MLLVEQDICTGRPAAQIARIGPATLARARQRNGIKPQMLQGQIDLEAAVRSSKMAARHSAGESTLFKRLITRAFQEDDYGKAHALYGENPGIYRVILMDTACQAPEPLPRLLATDSEGVLYIGTGKFLLGRFGGLRTAIYAAYGFEGSAGHRFRNLAPHSIGKMMVAAGFPTRFGRERIVIDLEGIPGGTSMPEGYNHFAHEAEALKNYMRQFGELPPFNSSVGRGERQAVAMAVDEEEVS